MKQLFIKQGQATLEEVPAPSLDGGSVLVRVSHSCISSGTELSGVRSSGQSLWKRALKRPEEVRKVIEMATTQGIAKTRSVVTGRLAEGLAVGYSAAGIVLEAGAGVDEMRPGDRVACAGTGYASHAEIIRVPRNLVSSVPNELDMGVASTVALGAIALQGLRRAQPTLGETFVVVGLGALGQLTVQLLKANGCRVIGTDVNGSRIALAMKLGMDAGLDADGSTEIIRIRKLTRDVGADGVIITASGASDAIVSTAFKMCRRRGRVILVGDVGLGLQRQDIYEKELDFLVSTSYGPGRYDAEYEEKGLSYPVGYVRWTESRNMQEYLDLAATGRIQVAPLIAKEFPIDAAAEAYAALSAPQDAPILAVLTYPTSAAPATAPTRIRNPAAPFTKSDHIKLAVVGPGGFVRAVHLPNLAAMAGTYDLSAIVSRSAPRATATARQFDAGYATTDFDAVLRDPRIDAVLIATRHNLHAGMATAALRAGKHVFLEKPLALTSSELAAVRAALEEDDARSKPILMTGYNRRFSPYARTMKELTADRSSPMVLSYRMNAGYIPPEHWVHGEEGGGRNLGEACHIYDLFTYLTDARVTSVAVQHIPPASRHHSQSDNFIATMNFDDGSIAALTYTSVGHRDFPKERAEVFFDGKVLVMDDYKELTVLGVKGKSFKTRLAEKGHAEELREFARGIRAGTWPIPLWQQMQASEIALQVQGHLCGKPV